MKLSEIKKNLEMVGELFKRYESVYLYGAGNFAKILLQWIESLGEMPDDIFVSNITKGKIMGMPISVYDPRKKYCGALIIAVSAKYHDEVCEKVNKNFEKIIIFDDEFFKCLETINNLEIRYGDYFWYKQGDALWNIECLDEKNAIWLQCSGGIGDSLILEPICRKLKEYGYKVGVLSWHSDVFHRSKSVDFLSTPSGKNIIYSGLFISVDGAYESHPFQHIIDSYIGLVKQFVFDIDIDGEDRIPIYDKSLIRCHDANVKRICVNIEASGWKSRIYDADRMATVLKALKNKGIEIFEIGSKRENYLGVGDDCFGLTLHNTVELMSSTDLYLGLDNGLMHLAQAIRLPVFILFGCVCPLYRIHDWSRARVMWKNVDELFCAGCYHRRQIPCCEPSCMNDDCYCMDWNPEEIIKGLDKLKCGDPPELKKKMLTPLWR